MFGGNRRSRGARVALVPLLALLSFAVAGAQTRFAYSSGQNLSPAYEGWMPNDDGSFTMYFGYMNTNWLRSLTSWSARRTLSSLAASTRVNLRISIRAATPSVTIQY